MRQVHVSGRCAAYGSKRNVQDLADARVGVVGLLRGDDAFTRLQLACNPKGFEIGHRTAAGKVAQRCLPAEHPAQLDYAFLFERRTRAPAVERMIVGVDPK